MPRVRRESVRRGQRDAAVRPRGLRARLSPAVPHPANRCDPCGCLVLPGVRPGGGGQEGGQEEVHA
eukprot:424898-Prymnesium_polylepis.1